MLYWIFNISLSSYKPMSDRTIELDEKGDQIFDDSKMFHFFTNLVEMCFYRIIDKVFNYHYPH